MDGVCAKPGVGPIHHSRTASTHPTPPWPALFQSGVRKRPNGAQKRCNFPGCRVGRPARQPLPCRTSPDPASSSPGPESQSLKVASGRGSAAARPCWRSGPWRGNQTTKRIPVGWETLAMNAFKRAGSRGVSPWGADVSLAHASRVVWSIVLSPRSFLHALAPRPATSQLYHELPQFVAHVSIPAFLLAGWLAQSPFRLGRRWTAARRPPVSRKLSSEAAGIRLSDANSLVFFLAGPLVETKRSTKSSPRVLRNLHCVEHTRLR